MEEQKQRRKRKTRFPHQLNIRVNDRQLNELEAVTAAMDEDRAVTIREALEIGVKRLQKRHGVGHG